MAYWVESKKYWQTKVTNSEGKRKAFYCSTPGRKGKAECDRKAREWLDGSFETSDSRCRDLIDRYLSTVPRYDTAMDGTRVPTEKYRKLDSHFRNYILPEIGMVKMSALKLYHLQAIIDKAAASGLAHKTLNNIRGSMSVWLTWCRKNGFTQLSTELVDIPKARSVEKTILQPADFRRLFSDELQDWYLNLYRFAVVTGLRFGELLALQRRNIVDGVLLVRGSVNESGVMTRGKNENAVRDIVLPPIALTILHDQFEMLKANSINSSFIFPNKKGTVSNQSTVRHHWESLCEAAEMPHTTVYELRHTYVSICSARPDFSLADLKATVGHSKNMDTLGVYGHKISENDKKIARMLNETFESLLGEQPILQPTFSKK